ncbi:MAG: ThuA domain-containing protein [Candidatus Omnitrophica bacterium]|nr:ThuA domain-containing protein [Candidatus Omnitrophota bacterium]
MPKKTRILIVSTGRIHDFAMAGHLIEERLASEVDFDVTLSFDLEPISEAGLRRFDVLILYVQEERLSKNQTSDLVTWVSKGKTLIGLHCATASFLDNPEYGRLLGWRFSNHGPIHRSEVEPTETDHPITRRIPPFKVEDELYLLEDLAGDSEILLTARWQGGKQPILTFRQEGKGKVVYFALGHDARSLGDPTFQKILLRSIRWTRGVTESGPIRCGVIGYGGAYNMGREHGRLIEATRGLELVGVCDLDSTRLALAKEDFPSVAVFPSYRRLLQMDELDLVVLVTPHNTHAALAVQCLNAGKHVITEKPMCITVTEAKKMVGAAKRKKRMLSVFHNRRWDGDYTTLKRIVASGAIGEIFQIEVFSGGYEHPGWWWRSDKKISGGCLHDWGAHFIDWFLDLIPSPVIDVAGHFHKRHWHAVTNEDHALATLRFKSGVTATIEQSNLAAAPKDRWRVLGTQGAATWKGWGEDFWNVISYKDSDEPVVSRVPFEKGDWHAYYRNIADHLTLGEELVVKGEDGLRIISMIEAAEKSSKARKSVKPEVG